MKIGILTSFKEDCTEEDFLIAKSFAQDGHKVDLLDFPITFDFEKVYDLLILKNAWDLDEKTYMNYFDQLNKLYRKVEKSKCKIVSSQDGEFKFDLLGKKYLADLFKAGFNVVPTIDDMADVEKLPLTEKYIKKPFVSYDGFDMQVLSRDQLKNVKLKNEVLQPKLNFISEVQIYFINKNFQYALEYKPHKWPDYPTPHEITPSKKYIQQAKKLIQQNGATCSFSRFDFLRLNEDEMILLEFADSNPNLSLLFLKKETLNKFLKNFKKAIYDYMKNEFTTRPQ